MLPNYLGQLKGEVESIPDYLKDSLSEYKSIINLGKDKWGIPDKMLLKIDLPKGKKVKLIIVEDK